jgi:glycosyltransferase involved in cell wall biosynthesis
MMGEMGPSPRQELALSVVIASYNAERTIQRCVRSLMRQATDEGFEIIVVDSSSDRTAELIAEEFPQVRLYRFVDRKFCGDSRNIGVSVARSDIIALTDADCTTSETWVDQILRAHRSPDLAIGGAIANAEPSGLVGWAAYFCEFSRWMPGSEPRWLDDIAGANMSYKKNAFDTYGPFVGGTYCSDSEFHWRLGRGGHRLRFVPQIIVSHHSIENLGEFLRHEFEHGRCFAHVRVQGQGFSTLTRLAYVLLSPLIPLKILLKTVVNNTTNRVYLVHFLKALPLVALGIVSWSAGELVGYCAAWSGWPADQE